MAKKKRGGAHGGHGWFVTFADLMALLMSFFVMVAAYSTQDQKKLQVVAGSMRDAFGTNKESKFAGIIESQGLPAADHVKYLRDIPPERASDRTTPPTTDSGLDDGIPDRGYPDAFGQAAASLRQAMQDMPEIAELSKNIIVAPSQRGLDVSIVDQDGRSMFPDGSTRPNDRTRRLLEKIAPTLAKLPNRIAVTGFTASDRPGIRPPAPPWELSAGRAVSVREILANAGVPGDRFASVAGKADTEPMFPDNPYLAANRRVTVTLLSEAAPTPSGKRVP
ncbi:OmpA/MotB family protein [Methylobacterium organophilum]|uniref:Motility protein B n=1 Tax=Methylobacterium organophilum TaxID=410 RepID=A0ABQ4T6N0_METOR|nr:flagellar motor protein MotB [Methylobacterium organophilum]UMY17664.1 flagellar motor protein MotB [Methylobacterium organophilum]GJE26109.1 Motility protein B [Methylobacterium organophilum]